MKKLLFAFMLGVFAIFALPSCSGGDSAAADKLAGMELTKDNASEWIETFNAAVDDCIKACEAKDEAKANAIANEIAKAMDNMDKAGDALDDSQKMTVFLKAASMVEAAEKAGFKLE